MPLSKTYRIETERLIIRCYKPGDAISLNDEINASLDHLRVWMPWALEEPKGLESKVELIRLFRGQFDLGQDYVFGIFLKSTETGEPERLQLIGSTGLHKRIGKNAREIGYWIGSSYIGKGYATEAVLALMNVGFMIEGLGRIEIHCHPQNHNSQRIPEKLGYRLEKVKDVMVQKLVFWTMTRAEFKKKRLSSGVLKAFDILGREIKMKNSGRKNL